MRYKVFGFSNVIVVSRNFAHISMPEGGVGCVCVCVCVVVGSDTVHESMNQEKDGLYLQHLSCWGYG